MTIKTTKEKINGVEHTVVRKPFNAEWVRGQLDIGIPVLMDSPQHLPHKHIVTAYNEDEFQSSINSEYGYEFNSARDSWNKESDCRNVLTILPALPRHPKPEHAALLYAYMAQGIMPKVNYEGDMIDSIYKQWPNLELTHATDPQGNKIDIAITDKEVV